MKCEKNVDNSACKREVIDKQQTNYFIAKDKTNKQKH